MAVVPVLVPIYGRGGVVVNYARVSPEDAKKVLAVRWSMTSDGKYAKGEVDGVMTLMHHLVHGKPANTRLEVVDHWDGDGLNNVRENLRTITYKLNSQRKSESTDKETKSSKFFGVSRGERDEKWKAETPGFKCNYETAEEAAKAYDAYVLVKHEKGGADPRTNGLVTRADLESGAYVLEPSRDASKTLLRGISEANGKFHVRIMSKGKTFYRLCATLEEAERVLKDVMDGIAEAAAAALAALPILRDAEGIAVIRWHKPHKSCEGGAKAYARVDDQHWHMLMGACKSWGAHTDGYVIGWVDGKMQFMHGLLLPNDNPKLVVDHKNKIRDDNRLSVNLHLVSVNHNNQNRAPSGKSGYLGVFETRNGRWQVQIRHVHKRHCGGTFDTKEKAAYRYNEMALQLYGPGANLNVLV